MFTWSTAVILCSQDTGNNTFLYDPNGTFLKDVLIATCPVYFMAGLRKPVVSLLFIGLFQLKLFDWFSWFKDAKSGYRDMLESLNVAIISFLFKSGQHL